MQYFSHSFLVKATSKKEAERILEEDWNKADYCYEKTTDCPDNTDTTIKCHGEADTSVLNNFRIIN